MSEHEDQLAAMRAGIDQAKAAGIEVAGTLWVFYAALTKEGFTPDQALTLTLTFLVQYNAGGEGGGRG